MNRDLDKLLTKAKAAIMNARPEKAIEYIEEFSEMAESSTLSDDDKEEIRASIGNLLRLAEASLRGAQSAVERIAEIVKEARSLQVYNENGQRQETLIVAHQPRRF